MEAESEKKELINKLITAITQDKDILQDQRNELELKKANHEWYDYKIQFWNTKLNFLSKLNEIPSSEIEYDFECFLYGVAFRCRMEDGDENILNLAIKLSEYYLSKDIISSTLKQAGLGH